MACTGAKVNQNSHLVKWTIGKPPAHSNKMIAKKDKVIVIGAGVFGLSTALELRRRGYKNITILDRALPPVPDGSSVDVSRIIRYDYGDPFYAEMAKLATDEWKSDTWAQFYHNSGFVLASQQSPEDPYIAKCKQVLRQQGHEIKNFDNSEQLVHRFPALAGIESGFNGYVNEKGGWADAAGSIRRLAELCSEEGVSFCTGPAGTVQSLVVENARVIGVNTKTASLQCEQVILATGAWSNLLGDFSSAVGASGQPVAFVQLSADEALSLAQMPVLINFSSGVFIFPPTPGTNLLKLARHSHGFAMSGDKRSTPILDRHGAAEDFIPEEASQALREGLRDILPQFGDRPWLRRRLCWYTDTPDGDFVVDHHPQIAGLFLATGGAGQ